jgi:mono/diheme cytochrome c family protein
MRAVHLITAVTGSLWIASLLPAQQQQKQQSLAPLEILKSTCATCHSGETAAGQLRLDSPEHIAASGSIIPGNAAQSRLIHRILSTDRAKRMPPIGNGLPADQIATLQSWVDQGAPGLPVRPVAVVAIPDFARDIEPVFKRSCYGCHSGTQPRAMLRLDAKSAALQGGNSGPVITPGSSGESRLVHRIEGRNGEQRMPLRGDPLTPAEIAAIRAWIDSGAKWPSEQSITATVDKHWSYKKPQQAAPPSVKGTARNPLDQFVLAKLEAQGMRFQPEAAKEILIRRVSLDLIGLPPSPQEVEEFVRDGRPGAYERLVDRLLASPRYGERWARPWLDLARYADTNGYEKDNRRTMWKYRDWVIDALNRDMPFDQFTIEQIAGDLLPNATVEQKIATGFHRNTMLNEEGGVDKDEAHFEVLVDRVNTTGQVWLASTVGCTQCHNHKYDPFTQKDYYSLMAFFNTTKKAAKDYGDTSTKWVEPELDLATPAQDVKRRELRAKIDVLDEKLKTSTPALEAEQISWERKVASAVNDWKPLQDAKASSVHGARLSAQPDGAFLASGENARDETYVIEGLATGPVVAAVRIEALPDPSLPRGGPGRDAYGNAIVSEVRVEVDERPVEWSRVLTDDGRAGTGKTLWTFDASRDETRVARQLVLIAKTPASGSRVRVTIRQDSEFNGQALGRFRITATGTGDPAAAAIVQVRASLRPFLLSLQRTPDQQKEIAAYYRSISPSLSADRDALRDARNELDRLGVVTALIFEEDQKDKPCDNIRTRGGYANRAAEVCADVPGFIAPFPANAPRNRLGLAQWLAGKDNPLTARVAVNRMWEQFFGRGLVETSEDFGSQGERPVNQPLLDWLAVEFMNSGWSMKSMHRMIATSAAYRQSSDVTPEILQADPYNRLHSRGPRFRLEAEMMRDFTLSAAGLLSAKIGGPSVFPYQPAGVWDVPYSGDKWIESKGEDRHRRGIYTFARRSAMYPSMVNFDATSREVCTVRRIRTNTPLQALTGLNDPAYFEAAQALARRIAAEGGASMPDRIRYGFRIVTSRAPGPAELDRMSSWIEQEAAYFKTHEAEARKLADSPDSAAWTMFSNVLLNLDEAVTKH